MGNGILRFEKEKFGDASALDTGVVYSWTWNSEITKELIDRELPEMKKQGIKGFYVLPEPKEFRPNHMATHLKPDYLTDEFFELVRYAVEKGRELGLSVWLYDEGGWPSGGACGQIIEKYPDARAKCIREETLSLKKGETVDETDKLAVFTKDFKRLSLPYTAEADEEVYVYAERFLDCIYTYVLDDRVMNEFINSTYEGYKKHLGELFGNYADAIFTDEPNVSFPYCIDIEEFEKISGYCFKDNLPALFHNGISAEADTFKICYIEYAGGQFEEKYMKRLKNWCSENGILFTGHMPGEDILENFWHCVGNPLRHLRHFDIPGMDSIWQQIFPGNKKNNFFPRVASSAAHHTGKSLAVSESFAAYGSGVTFDTMRYVANYQFVRGINIINIMSMTTGKDRFLSGQLRPHFAKEMPQWKHLKEFNDYISRMMYVCSIGDYVSDTAIYMPIRDVWTGCDVAEKKYDKMGRELEEKQVYFDIIDDEFLKDCEIRDGRLCMGNAEYRYVYIPQCRNMSVRAIEKLEEFIACGGRVFGELNGAEVYDKDNIAAEPVIKTDNKNLRAMKKKSEKESIYVIYNEAPHEIFAEVEIPDEENCFRLNMHTGGIEKLDGNKISINLVSGEVYAVICTDEALSEEKCDEKSAELFVEISDFEVVPKEQFVADNGKIECVSENIVIDKKFSGSAVYKCEFECCGDNDVLIEFEGLHYYAKVLVNGYEAGSAIMEPKRVTVAEKYLKEKNTLEIVVSNTAANAFYYADVSGVDKKSVGPYNDMTKIFEKASLKFGLDKVRLYEVK